MGGTVNLGSYPREERKSHLMVRELGSWGVYPPLQGCSWGRRKSGKAWLFPADMTIYFLLLLFNHSVVSDSATPWTAARQASLFFTISWSLLKLMSESVMPPNHLILSSPSLPAFNLSQHQGSFPVSQFFTSGCQNIGASASASVLPMNI